MTSIKLLAPRDEGKVANSTLSLSGSISIKVVNPTSAMGDWFYYQSITRACQQVPSIPQA